MHSSPEEKEIRVIPYFCWWSTFPLPWKLWIRICAHCCVVKRPLLSVDMFIVFCFRTFLKSIKSSIIAAVIKKKYNKSRHNANQRKGYTPLSPEISQHVFFPPQYSFLFSPPPPPTTAGHPQARAGQAWGHQRSLLQDACPPGHELDRFTPNFVGSWLLSELRPRSRYLKNNLAACLLSDRQRLRSCGLCRRRCCPYFFLVLGAPVYLISMSHHSDFVDFFALTRLETWVELFSVTSERSFTSMSLKAMTFGENHAAS